MLVRLPMILSVLGALVPPAAHAQSVVGERFEYCDEREVLVWGRKNDLRLFRGNRDEVDINRGEPVVWFCGRERLEVECPLSQTVDQMTVIWDKDGRLIFQCLR